MSGNLQAQYANMGAEMLSEAKAYITKDDGHQWDNLAAGVRAHREARPNSIVFTC